MPRGLINRSTQPRIIALGNHYIVEVTLCVDHVLKFCIFVYKYNPDNDRGETEKKLQDQEKDQENLKK